MILVTGANGMVGSYVKEVFTDEELTLTDLPEMDVTDRDKVFGLVSKHKPDLVLHLAAETNVDRCESAVEHAYRTNTMGTQHVALACQKYGAIMVYISTGGVFNGQPRQVHTEFDVPAPANLYSRSKLEGEYVVRDFLTKYYIFRAGWMIGGGPSKDKKFVGKIIELSRTRSELEVVSDKFGSLTFARDFVKGIRQVIRTGNFGLYHLVNSGVVNRYEIAQEIVKLLGVKVKVLPVSSDHFPLPAPRAASEAMRNYKLELLCLNPMPNWRPALAQYLKEWK